MATRGRGHVSTLWHARRRRGRDMHAHLVSRRSILRRSALLVLAAGGASILAACGGASPAATTAPAAQAPTTAPAAQPAPTTAPAGAAAPAAPAKTGAVTIRYYQFMNSVED